MSWIDPASFALGLVIGAAAVLGWGFWLAHVRKAQERPADPPRGWQ